MKVVETAAGRSMPPLIILAGGASARFGSPKGLARWHDRTLLAAHIFSYAGTGTDVIVVTGEHTEVYGTEIKLITSEVQQFGSNCSVRQVRNPDPDRGPFSSIQIGLTHLGQAAMRGVFIQPVDSGPVPAALFAEMAALSEGGALTVMPQFSGRGGHPVLLSCALACKCARQDWSHPQARLDFLLRDEPRERMVRLPVGAPGVLFNFNHPSDLTGKQTPS
jgi:CTP:molybdopterin cytidylyltransferase MocA